MSRKESGQFLPDLKNWHDDDETSNPVPPTQSLGDGRQVVLDLRRFQAAEPRAVTDADLDVVLGHLPLEALLQRQDGRVHSVFQLKVLAVPGRERKEVIKWAHTPPYSPCPWQRKSLIQWGHNPQGSRCTWHRQRKWLNGDTLLQILPVHGKERKEVINSVGTQSSRFSLYLHSSRLSLYLASD